MFFEKFKEDFSYMFSEDNYYYDLSTGSGWNNLIRKLFEDIVALDINKKVSIWQIKEKFGTARIYIGFDNSVEHDNDEEIHFKIRSLIDFAERRSGEICEECASEENVTTSSGKIGWIKTYCDQCRKTIEDQTLKEREERNKRYEEKS